MNREKTIAALAVILLRIVFSTIRLRFNDRPGITDGRYTRPVIMCFWHNRILAITHCFLRKYPRTTRKGVSVLTSPSRDGEILARVANGLGMGAVRGSSSRKGSQALREMVRLIETGKDIAITPDGPRGPRYHLNPGAILLAQSTGAVLAPVHAKFSHAIRLKTWDGFTIPLPFSTITVTVDTPIPVSKQLTEEEFETTRSQLETLLENEAD